jgi:hypothetical protein
MSQEEKQQGNPEQRDAVEQDMRWYKAAWPANWRELWEADKRQAKWDREMWEAGK